MSDILAQLNNCSAKARPACPAVVRRGRSGNTEINASAIFWGFVVILKAALALNPSGRLHSSVMNTGFLKAHVSKTVMGRPSIQGKMLIAISESRRPPRNSVRYPVNAGLCIGKVEDDSESASTRRG